MTKAVIQGISPFFAVLDVPRSVAFYRDRLGFAVLFEEGDFFAMVARDAAQLFLKSQVGIAPAPNPARHRALRWDAYLSVPDPDALAAEFAARGTPFATPLADTSDGLRGFEIADPDGYVLFFGRPR
ncbi:MAG TPA: VOC family protein [Rhizomicrobium sp.]|jgi:catechol 2,3-dioxygenase-like lactoylglutathione lyase family enzyme|nr:VOC family protein [Rhizomicrobium sp.]